MFWTGFIAGTSSSLVFGLVTLFYVIKTLSEPNKAEN
jgi:hypothetical protein